MPWRSSSCRSTGALFPSARLADRVAVSHAAWAALAAAIGTGAAWVALSIVARRIRGRLGEQDRLAKVAQLAKQEVDSLNRARSLFDGEHFDLCVVEAWRALEARLRAALLSRRVFVRADCPDRVIHVAVKKGLLREPALGVVEELRRHWAVAVSTDPLSREAAVESLRRRPSRALQIPTHPSAAAGGATGDQVRKRVLAGV